MAVTLTIVCVPLGGTLAGLVAIPALPALGWRALFVIGGVVPILTAVVLFRLLPESPRYLARHPARWTELRTTLRPGWGWRWKPTRRLRIPTSASAGAAPLDSRAPYLGDSLALWVAFVSCLLAVYFAFSWLPTIMTGAGLGSSVASSAISVFNLGGVAGALAGAFLIGRFGSKPTLLALAAGAVGGAVTLSLATFDSGRALALLVLLGGTGGFINAVQTTMYTLAAHVYPTAMRATGVGAAVAVGRLGAILSGYAGPWALESGTGAFFLLMAAALATTFMALAAVRRHVPVAGV